MASARTRLWLPARNASFRLLWLGQSFSLLGDGFSYIAFSWITLSLTSSTLILGYVLALQAVPRALLTLVGGSLSDKWSARRMMAFSSWARSVVMLTVAAVALSGLLSIWLLLVSAAVFGAVDAFFQPARSSILPSVVDHDTLTSANALLGVGSRVAAVLGPALGGIVVAVSNASYGFLVDGISFAICGLCVMGVRTLPPQLRSEEPAESSDASADPLAEAGPHGEPDEDAAEPTLLGRIRAGVKHAWADPRIRTMLAIDTVVSFCYAGPFTVGFADLAKFRLEGGSTALGLMDGALAAGAMLGALAGGLIDGRLRVGLLVSALAGWLAVGMTLLALTHTVVIAVAVVLAMGFAIGFQGVFGLSWIQRNIQGSLLSRVISVDMVLGYTAAPVSLVLCGGLAETHAAFMFFCIAGILALTALAILTSRPVRKMS
jgi:MFS family permease